MLIDCQECKNKECLGCPVAIQLQQRTLKDQMCPICCAYFDHEGFYQCDEQE